MYQAIYDPTKPEFNRIIVQSATLELQRKGFELETITPWEAVFRHGDRYIVFFLDGDTLALRLGVGSWDPMQTNVNSMRLDEMIRFLYGSLQRGCQPLDKDGMEGCLHRAVKDLSEFAHEFVGGDFRPFLRILSLKKREDLNSQVKELNRAYMA